MSERKASSSRFEASLSRLRTKLLREEPRRAAGAGVAVVFRRDGFILLMLRAVKEGDPWSGQVAFPGGRSEPGDGSFRETAERETLEEMGVDLRARARFMGYLGLFRARSREMTVVPSVFLLKGTEMEARPNREVSSYRWAPVGVFESSRSVYTMDHEGMKLSFPAYALGDYVVWGLTERIISALLGYL